MNPKELNTTISEILEQEAKKLIMEQINKVDHLIDSVKSFQSLSGLLNKIDGIEGSGTDGSSIFINIKGITPEELIQCCGGTSLGKAETNLMQGIHHDLEDNGFGGDFDVDVDTSGDENALNLTIRIIPNTDNILSDMEEDEDGMKDTNPTIDDKKDVILGVKQIKEKNTGIEMAKNESTQKKIITLSESEMVDLLDKIVKEAVSPSGVGNVSNAPTNVAPGGVPGLDVAKKARSDSGKENNDALQAVEKKIKAYLSFEGNDNPEFPKAIGKGTKVARENSKKEDETVEDNRGRGPQDLEYDQEPSETFKERAKLSLVGSSELGNPVKDVANAIKTDVGDDMAKEAEKRQKIRKEEPLYKKEAVPVETASKTEPKRGVKPAVVEKDIERMKQMAEYNKKTQ